MDKTTYFDIAKFKSEVITNKLNEVVSILKERGYNPINQIVGYIINNDSAYITNYKNARSIIKDIDINELVALLLKNTLEK